MSKGHRNLAMVESILPDIRADAARELRRAAAMASSALLACTRWAVLIEVDPSRAISQMQRPL